MRDFSIEDLLKKIISKLLKKDRNTYAALMNKIDEILSVQMSIITKISMRLCSI
ncbi:TPA: hypothetical protein HA246_05380 [Candidatus Woesearchaeota archaeon]|nr:hypothetical protein [Candidatus Woesearchaeota archaeon]